jgi:hypothetical protein
MIIKMIVGDLLDKMPEYIARGNWSNLIGAGFCHQITKTKTNEQITFIEILEINKWNEHMSETDAETLSSIQEVNELITLNNVVLFESTNEPLMTANLNHLVSQGMISFEDLAVDMTEQEELSYLYSKGCSGISKRQKYQLLPNE